MCLRFARSVYAERVESNADPMPPVTLLRSRARWRDHRLAAPQIRINKSTQIREECDISIYAASSLEIVGSGGQNCLVTADNYQS